MVCTVAGGIFWATQPNLVPFTSAGPPGASSGDPSVAVPPVTASPESESSALKEPPPDPLPSTPEPPSSSLSPSGGAGAGPRAAAPDPREVPTPPGTRDVENALQTRRPTTAEIAATSGVGAPVTGIPVTGSAAAVPSPSPSPPPAEPPVSTPPVSALPTPVAPPVDASLAPTAPSEPPGESQEPQVRGVLARFAAAYSSLDAADARAVWPSVDQRALAKAFAGLSSQRLSLGECEIKVTGAAARADCVGSATWTPRVGGRTRTVQRQWSFDLAQVGAGWRIMHAESW
jgi:hypothetical protein